MVILFLKETDEDRMIDEKCDIWKIMENEMMVMTWGGKRHSENDKETK